MALSPKQEMFCREYLLDLNGTQAAIRAGYSRKTAAEQAARLLVIVKIAERIAELMYERSARTQIQADEVLRQLMAIATADPNELIELRRVCCRYCHGAGHRYQRTPAELERDRREWELARSKRGGHKLGPFDEAGGDGYDTRKGPHPHCPECHGEGVARAFAKDTRNLSPSARLLFAGVKVTRDGLEVLMRDRDAAIILVGKHLGMFTSRTRVEHSGPGGGPIRSKDEQDHRFSLTKEDLAAFERLMEEVTALDLLPDGGGQLVE